MRIYYLLIILLLAAGCTDLDKLSTLQVESNEVAVAVPLVNTTLSVGDVVGEQDSIDNNVRIRIDGEGRVALIYQGDVVRRGLFDVFPPFPFFALPLVDTNSVAPIPFAADQRIDKAIFTGTNIIFGFTSSETEDIDVTVRVPQLSLAGEVFSQKYTVPHGGGTPTAFTSEPFALEDWTLQSDNNIIEIIYDARRSDGSRIALDEATVLFDIISFKYIEGYFGNDVFDISGSFIPVGVLDNWVSGGLSFEDPKVNVTTENSFGFPVRSIFNDMSIITTTGEKVTMESDIIDNNVDFGFPTIDEIGTVKSTDFSFTKENSNIVQLFEERVRRVVYDIDAGANPDNDDSILNHVNSDSYFLVSVDVELPLEGRVLALELQDTVSADLGQLADVDSAEFKIVINNGFSAELQLQAYVYDATNTLQDSLFNSAIVLPPAPINPSTLIAEDGQETITFAGYNTDKIGRLSNGDKILLNVKIDTGNASADPLWIYADYGVDLRIGAILITDL